MQGFNAKLIILTSHFSKQYPEGARPSERLYYFFPKTIPRVPDPRSIYFTFFQKISRGCKTLGASTLLSENDYSVSMGQEPIGR
jgi:hypothetical protein